MTATDALERIGDIVQNRHNYVERWKSAAGSPVVGYFCCYMPEELVHAFGMLPVRILSSPEPPLLADPWMLPFTCGFSRSCVHNWVKGMYSYVDALVYPFTCYYTYAAWQACAQSRPLPFSHQIFVPRPVESNSARHIFVKELGAFVRALEEWRGQRLSQERLLASMEVHNLNRRLLKDIYRLKKDKPGVLSGAETLEVVLAGMFIPKETHNALLTDLLRELAHREAPDTAKPRIMVVGSEMDNPDVVRMVESQGLQVVVDDLCMGTRYFWGETPSGSDPLSSLAERYLLKPSCPTKLPSRQLEHILALAEEYQVQAVVEVRQKWCTPHAANLPRLEEALRKKGIPFCSVELDIRPSEGQIKTRAQALAEVLELGALF